MFQRAAVWNDTTTPSYDQCESVIDLQPLDRSEIQNYVPRQGEAFCLDTSGTALVFFRIVSPTGTTGGIQAEVTRWSPRPN